VADAAADEVKRVRLLGAESTGKTTLARALADSYATLWNPEFGRPYTEIGRDRQAPWTSAEFTHIARIQCWYEDFLACYAHRVLFCDTDAYTTAVFHEVYLGSPTDAFADLTNRSYALTIVCGLDVPWSHDGVREFEEQRRWMHDRYLDHARGSGRPWLLVEGSLERRLAEARTAIDPTLAT
jgi:NadR type nicotinamide-nucleotide adenylyltransferase